MNDLIICKYDKCRKHLLDPVLLPCSNNICKSHVETIVGDTFCCIVCKSDHEVPTKGFTSNTVLKHMIELNVHLNENERKSAESISKLKEKFEKFELIVKNPESFIYENISSIRNKIDLERERLILEINNLSDEMIRKLKKHEEECNANLINLEDLNDQHKVYLSKVTSQIIEMKEKMRYSNNDRTYLDDIFRESSKLMDDLVKKYATFKRDLMMNKNISFVKFESKLFGELLFKCSTLNEKLVDVNSEPKILTGNQFYDLIKLCEFSSQSKFKLIYQATRDGFSAQTFHSKCDKIPKTVTLIKVKGNSNVFGGFTSLTWDSSPDWNYDESAFIFSLINKDNRPLKINVAKASCAIDCDATQGPIFGRDIVISSYSNKNFESYSNLGHSYKNDLYPRGSTEAKIYLAGSKYFSTEEIEVYQVI